MAGLEGATRLRAVNHLTYNVTDKARALRFWEDVLGTKQIPSQVDLEHIIWLHPDSPPDMVGSCLVCFQGVSGCRPGVTHDMIGHRTGSRAPSLRVSAAVRCQLWLFSGRRRHGQAWQLGRVAYKPMLQAGLLCSIRLGSQRQYPLPRPEQQLV